MTADTSGREGQVREIGDSTPVVLALVAESPGSVAVLELACLLARRREARIEFVFTISVPRALELEAPLAEAEAAAAQALAAAQQIAERYELSARTFTYRARSAQGALLLAAEAHHPDLVVIPLGPGPAEGDWGPVAGDLAKRVPCEVIVDRLPA
jgi:nucleotide-binding universal stress UspA family protein